MKGLLSYKMFMMFEYIFFFIITNPELKVTLIYCVLIVVNMWVSFSRHFNTRGQYVKHIHLTAINACLEKFNWKGVMAQAYIKL